jgi:hypothetical protein
MSSPALLRSLGWCLRVAWVCAAALLAAAPACPAGQADTGETAARKDLEIVECLLPGAVRLMGNRTYLTQRRPTRTTGQDCRVRGGEYVLYDRADYKTALGYWMSAAEEGDVEAQTNVGEILERGVGGTPDPAAAAAWYQKAADKGYSRARFDLGTLYEQGLGVPQDRVRALNLYRQAWGVPEDSVMLRSAADEQSQALRAKLEAELTEKDRQLEVLRGQLNELQKRPPPAPAADPAAAKAAADAARQIATLQGLITRLESESATGRQRLAALPERGSREEVPVPAWSHDAQVQWLKGAQLGRYFALVIGNQSYQKLEPLRTPRNDVERLAQLLQTRYGFTVQVVEDASDVTMLRALNELNKVLKPNDNLLIYYTGHGERMKGGGGMEAGYWLPVNAERPPDDTFWVSNDQVTAHLGRLPALRVLVLADSCYSGLLWSDPDVNVFGTEGLVSIDYVKYKLPRRTRLLLASGGDRPVPGGGAEGTSVFARALLDVLTSNKDILSAPGLLLQVRRHLQEKAPHDPATQAPDLKAIKAAGHELGDFFFVPRG